MFDPAEKPRVFALPPGADFPRALVDGLRQHFDGQPAQNLAHVQLIVNTRRMARRVRTLFDDGPALLLPKIQLVTDLGEATDLDAFAPPVPPLRRRLELVQLVSHLLNQQPDIAPRASLYDLADSLAALMAEMQGEGVSPSTIKSLDVSDQSGHWERAKAFLEIVQHYFGDGGAAPDAEARQRLVTERLIARWADTPPQHPIIIAGSTGSRGATQLLMQAVARLSQGALILPGFDFDMPPALWSSLDDALLSEDHPQYRFHKLMIGLEIGRNDIRPWGDAIPPNAARNRLISLALRPAPITDQWLSEGPNLGDIPAATRDITLLEAQSSREEALAIALRLRQAAENGEIAALITPDRALTRQVSAALDRWKIIPDDSAGLPLQLSPIGRLLRHISQLFETRLTAEALLTILKHPLTHAASDRGTHLLWTHELELHIRRHGPPYPDVAYLHLWAVNRKNEDANGWVDWLCKCFTNIETPGEIHISDRLDSHLNLLEMIIQGHVPDAKAQPWCHDDGREAKRIIDDLIQSADAGGEMTARDYSDLFGAVLSGGEVRAPDAPHPNILIWGTLEARVQGADLVILAGLNEGSWPEAPSPDPWLNRKMRHDAGLLLPERRIGLSAHDFQQAAAAPQVWFTRSIRSDDAETVSSRWISRITNLLGGLPEQGGKSALANMRNRGQIWATRARLLETAGTTKPAHRPSPQPPVSARPRKLSVTEIKHLIRDPYAIYAKHVLRLRPLNPIMKTPDALARGIVIHTVMETFIRDTADTPNLRTHDILIDTARQILIDEIPWPAARILWLSRLDRIADGFLADEDARRSIADPISYEIRGRLDLGTPEFSLTATADRIDRDDAGNLHIYDYKTGAPPSAAAQSKFDKQLLLETVIAQNGKFFDIPPAIVSRALFIGLGSKPGQTPAPLDKETPEKTLSEFRALTSSYLTQEQGFTARRALFKTEDVGNYDQLARFGEWDSSDDPIPEVLI